MQSNDPHILAAMDGRESASPSDTPQPLKEPTAFFFVVFGLVYDALASSSTDSTSAGVSREITITALETLKSLVRPEYSGKAILDPVIYEEFSGLCYRMALTESAAVQVYLVEAIAVLANGQSFNLIPRYALLLVYVIMVYVSKPIREQADSKSFPPDSPLTHCLRICAYVLRHALPSARTAIAR
jgi:HEAT repeat-containing protein 5